MKTTQQAYIEGFVKRANEYGFNQQEAISLLKESGFLDEMQKNVGDVQKRVGDAVRQAQDSLESEAWNGTVGNLTSAGIPFHKAVYGLRNVSPGEGKNAVNDLIGSKYDKDMYPIDHPILSNIGDALRSHNIDPTHAALAAGGVGLLGGGYMLGKHLNKKKHPEQQ